MPYRRPYKRARYGKKLKYSVQQKAFEFSAAPGVTTKGVVVPAATVEGMRKVKHLMITVQQEPGAALYWALVYVPQGTTPNDLDLGGTAGMYEPNQFVMNCGISDVNAGPIRFSSPLARNLNDGDAIYLLVRPAGFTEEVVVRSVIRYAISLQ